jgi:hypothetical protein
LIGAVQYALHAGKRKMGRWARDLILFSEKPDMQRACTGNTDIKQLLSYYRHLFRVPEKANHYLTRDDKIAEKKFVKHTVLYVGAGGHKHVF